MIDCYSPRLIVEAALNGACKTSIAKQMLSHERMAGCIYVNPDFSARGPFGDLNPLRSVVKVAQKAAGIRDHRWNEEKSVTFAVLSAQVMERPIGKIISRCAKSVAKCFLMEKISDRSYRYDNSVEEQACLLFRVANGALIKIYESINPWASKIVGVLDVASSNGNRK